MIDKGIYEIMFYEIKIRVFGFWFKENMFRSYGKRYVIKDYRR